MKPGNLHNVWCQIRRQTRDEDSIDTHIESRCAVFYFRQTFVSVYLLTSYLLPQCCVMKSSKYTKYSFGFHPCPATESIADNMINHPYKPAWFGKLVVL